MATISFDREYILEDTPENIELIKKLNSKSKSTRKTQSISYTPPTESEKKEFASKLMKSRNW